MMADQEYSELMILLEYNPTNGLFHYNSVNEKNIPKSVPDTHGWESVAYTEEFKADVFCDILNCDLHERKRKKQKPFKTTYIKKRWKEFCYAFNRFLTGKEKLNKSKEVFIKESFNSATALARLGNHFFSEEENFSKTVNYNPLDYKESNI